MRPVVFKDDISGEFLRKRLSDGIAWLLAHMSFAYYLRSCNTNCVETDLFRKKFHSD